MLKIIYDAEIVSEEAILAWADEKQLAEEEEKVFVKKVWFARACACACVYCVMYACIGAQGCIPNYRPNTTTADAV
eukprot:1157526-Pelagomonas_calceolata.AAC.1